jgi:hypothetical protein
LPSSSIEKRGKTKMWNDSHFMVITHSCLLNCVMHPYDLWGVHMWAAIKC